MVKRVGELTDDRGVFISIRSRSPGSAIVRAMLTRKIGRKDRVGEPAMDVIGFAVMMVSLWVNMDQRNSQHPGRQPREECHACPQHIREHLWHESIHLDLARTVAQAANRVKCQDIS